MKKDICDDDGTAEINPKPVQLLKNNKIPERSKMVESTIARIREVPYFIAQPFGHL